MPGPLIRRALAASTDGNAVDVRCRIAATTGVDGQSILTLALESDTGGSRTRAIGLQAYLAGGGAATYLYDLTSGGSWGSQSAAFVPVDGTGWLRLVCARGWVHAYVGTGVGTAEPVASAWVLVASYSWASMTPPVYALTHIAVALVQGIGPAGAVTVDVGSVIESNLGEV
jgi:hypothetical protein